MRVICSRPVETLAQFFRTVFSFLFLAFLDVRRFGDDAEKTSLKMLSRLTAAT